MEEVIFQDKKCYIGYKALYEDGLNYMKNFRYDFGHWYGAIDVDDSDIECSFGLNVFLEEKEAMRFIIKYFSVSSIEKEVNIFKCYIPIENNKIIFRDNKARCKKFFLTSEKIDLTKYIEYLKDYITKNEPCFVNRFLSRYVNADFVNKNFNKLTSSELSNYYHLEGLNFKRIIQNFNADPGYFVYFKYFNYEDYWTTLNESQKSFIILNNKNFNFKKYWNDLCPYLKNLAIKREDFPFKDFWEELTTKEKCFVIKNNNFMTLEDKEWQTNDSFRMKFLLKNNVSCEEYWDIMNDTEKIKLIHMQEKNFNFDKYWYGMSNFLRDMVCSLSFFNFKKYWNELTCYEKQLISIYNENFNIEDYKDEVDFNLCISNPNFDYEKYWDSLTEGQRMYIIRTAKCDFKFEKLWDILNFYNKRLLKENIVIKDPKD